MRPALQDRDGEEADKVDDDIKIEKKELDLERQKPGMTKSPAQDFVPRSEVHDMVASETEKPTSHRNASVLARLVEDELIEAPQVGNDAVKGKTALYNLEREVSIEIREQGKIYSLLLTNSEALTKLDRLMNVLSQEVRDWQLLVTSIMAYVESHIYKNEEKHGLVQRL